MSFMDQRIKKRMDEIEAQRKIIEKAESRLKYLLGLSREDNGKGRDLLPDGFSLMNEIFKLFEENANKKVRTLEVVAMLKRKFNAPFERRIVQSTLAYLASPKKDLLIKEQERGVFSLKQKPPQSAG